MIKSFCGLCHKPCESHPPKIVRSVRVGEVSIPVIIQLQCGNLCDDHWQLLLAVLFNAGKIPD